MDFLSLVFARFLFNLVSCLVFLRSLAQSVPNGRTAGNEMGMRRVNPTKKQRTVQETGIHPRLFHDSMSQTCQRHGPNLLPMFIKK